MGKVANAVAGIRNFTGEVKGELKKSSWPSRSELVESTVVIIVTVLILGVFVGFCDVLIQKMLELIL